MTHPQIQGGTVAALSLVLGVVGCASRPAAPQSQRASQAAPASGAAAPPPAELTQGAGENRAPLVIQGSGALVAQPALGEPPPARGYTGNGYQLNFVDTDIAAVVGAVLGQAELAQPIARVGEEIEAKARPS